MLKKTITFTDYDGNERTEDFYFNLTKAEITEMNMGVSGGMEKFINKIVSTQDTPSLIKIFKDIIQMSYGVKSADGRRFIKTDEVKQEFMETEAYSQLFMELATDSDAAAKFINGIIPQDLAEKAAEAQKNNNIKALPES